MEIIRMDNGATVATLPESYKPVRPVAADDVVPMSGRFPAPYFVRGERVAWRQSFLWGDTSEIGTVVYVCGAQAGYPTPSNEAYWQDDRTYAPFMRYVVLWDDGTVSREHIGNLMSVE